MISQNSIVVRYLKICMGYVYGPTSAGSTQPGQCPGVGKLRLTYGWQLPRKGHYSNAGFVDSTQSGGLGIHNPCRSFSLQL